MWLKVQKVQKIQKRQGARATVIARLGEKYARVANACQAAEEMRIARKRRVAKMVHVLTFARFPMPAGPMPCARAPSTRKSAIVLQIILETQRLSALLKRKVSYTLSEPQIYPTNCTFHM